MRWIWYETTPNHSVNWLVWLIPWYIITPPPPPPIPLSCNQCILFSYWVYKQKSFMCDDQPQIQIQTSLKVLKLWKLPAKMMTQHGLHIGWCMGSYHWSRISQIFFYSGEIHPSDLACFVFEWVIAPTHPHTHTTAMNRIPMYYLLKILFLIFLMHPWFKVNSSSFVFSSLIFPLPLTILSFVGGRPCLQSLCEAVLEYVRERYWWWHWKSSKLAQ